MNARENTMGERKMFVFLGLRLFCSSDCAHAALADPPEDWRRQSEAVIVPRALLDFVRCECCDLTAKQVAEYRREGVVIR